MKKINGIYLIIACFAISIMTIGATYAYLTATTASSDEDIKTNSTSYNISMDITPIYEGFTIIPMNDNDAPKAIINKCKDKYGRGACFAYNIRVYGYREDLSHISGYMDITTNNMQNLSYMVFEESSLNEEGCVEVEENNYCTSKTQTAMNDGIHLSLGDSYQVFGKQETNLLLVIWLSNLNENQNNIDIGSFNASVTIQAGNGGEITGTIASAIQQQEPEEPEEP